MMPSPTDAATPSEPPIEQSAAPKRHLSVLYVIFLAVGMVVGAGIFKSPALVAENAGPPYAIYGVWILGGLISLAGALCYGELSTAYPNPGGDYYFLSKAYGDSVGFLFAWARIAIINTGSIALLGFVIGDYLNRVVDLGPNGPAIYALASVIVMTLFNLRGTKGGTGADYFITSLEVLGLLALTGAAAFLVISGTPPLTTQTPSPPTLSGIGYAMVFVLLAFGGWSEMATLSAEVEDPKRGMVHALVWAVIVITALYLTANWALLRGLGAQGLAQSQAPAADLMARAFGENAGIALAIAVAAAAITSINGTIIVGARTTFAAAKDRPTFAWLGRWDPSLGIPKNAIIGQGVVSIALVVLGGVYDGFETLVDYTAPVYWIFLIASGISVMILRHKMPNRERPFKVPLYPILPILFTLSSIAMLISSLNYVKAGASFGLGVLGVGLVVSLLTKRTA
jgi:basic amino acid/polyamine antiporter, APA family